MQWPRIVVASAAMLVAGLVWAFGFAYIVAWMSGQEGASLELFQTLVYVRIASAGLMSTALYTWFASGVRHRLLAHVLLLWLIAQGIDAAASILVFGVPPGELLTGSFLYARTLLWALLGYGIVRLVRTVRSGKHRNPPSENLEDDARQA